MEESADNFFTDTQHLIRRSLSSGRGFKILNRKEDNPRQFWDIIKNHHRPIVCVNNGEGFKSVFDFDGKYSDEIKFKNIRINSPVEVETLSEIGSSLVDIYYAGEREERARIRSLNEHIGQAAENVGKIMSTYDVIYNTKIPTGIKQYAHSIMDDLMEAQARLNYKVGLRVTHIDIIS